VGVKPSGKVGGVEAKRPADPDDGDAPSFHGVVDPRSRLAQKVSDPLNIEEAVRKRRRLTGGLAFPV
jgi:hypothetical protein